MDWGTSWRDGLAFHLAKRVNDKSSFLSELKQAIISSIYQGDSDVVIYSNATQDKVCRPMQGTKCAKEMNPPRVLRYQCDNKLLANPKIKFLWSGYDKDSQRLACRWADLINSSVAKSGAIEQSSIAHTWEHKWGDWGYELENLKEVIYLYNRLVPADKQVDPNNAEII